MDGAPRRKGTGMAPEPPAKRKSRVEGEKSASGTFGKEAARGAGVPPFKYVFCRFRGTIQLGPIQRRETQIVQSWLTPGHFLPVFRPHPVRAEGIPGRVRRDRRPAVQAVGVMRRDQGIAERAPLPVIEEVLVAHDDRWPPVGDWHQQRAPGLSRQSPRQRNGADRRIAIRPWTCRPRHQAPPSAPSPRVRPP